MKCLKVTFSASQIKALLRKDIIVRWRQLWMFIVQIVWPCMVFMLLYLVRLKYGPEHIKECQFPTRMLPTKNNVLHGFFSYICSIENKCMSTREYEEYSKLERAPMKPIVDIVQIFINDDRMFNAIIELPEKANFVSAVTTVVTSGHMDDIRKNVGKVVDLVPYVEKMLNGSFDVKQLFSDRNTFVKGGYILCGHPFPSTESIPLVNDILYSEDFSDVNDDEIKAMPTNYCKKLYRDVTSTNHGKLTWNVIKPIIHGKILYGPNNEETQNIMHYSNATFEELGRLKMLSLAVEQILTKLHEDETFQNGLNSLIKLAQSPLVKKLLGDEVDIDQIEGVINRIRTDPIIYDVVTTIKNIMECLSVDRFAPVDTEAELRKSAFDLNQQRLFWAALYFNKTSDADVSYKFHMDTDNTQPTIENKNRFWFPGPSSSMIRDMKYHRGFAQIKQVLDIGIIKHKKHEQRLQANTTEAPSTTTQSPLTVEIVTDDYNDDEDDDDWFTNSDVESSADKNETQTAPQNSTEQKPNALSSLFSGVDFSSLFGAGGKTESNVTVQLDSEEDDTDLEPTFRPTPLTPLVDGLGDVVRDVNLKTLSRQRRQGFFDLLLGLGNANQMADVFEVDNLKFYTKQFPYPDFIEDDFKTGLYLAQAIQVAFYLGLAAQICSCVRHRIWMHESRNSMMLRSMGLKPASEIISWILVTFFELLLIFLAVTVILYSGGILLYTQWIFIMLFLIIFGGCLVAFCFMCSTFFTSATIGSVATGILFFISYCPYIVVLLFDAQLNSLQNFGINLSFTTAFSNAWAHIMRLELQQIGLTFEAVFSEGLHGDFGFGVAMIILDMFIYIAVGYINQRYKENEYRFVEVQREDLDANMGATLTNVSKIYDENKIAVSNISLSLPKNQVTCLLGRNGAGKSTIIKMLTGQVIQTTGRVILSQAMTSKQDYDKVGVCSQDNILIPNLTAREHLEMYAKIKLKHGYKSEVIKTLKSLNFGKYERYQASQLSGGYQRRLCVAIAFIGSPNVVILDEPCNGVDYKARKDIWDLIERLRKGRAVVMATHFLDEAEYLSDAVIILKNGKIIARHNPESLRNYCSANYIVSMQCCNSSTTQQIIDTATKLLNNFKAVPQTKATDLCLEISYNQDSNSSSDFLGMLESLQNEGLICDLCVESQNLEHFFKDLEEHHSKVSNGNAVELLKNVQLNKHSNADVVREQPLTRWEAMCELFRKRVIHFSRNYRMLLCVIVLPAIFEILAMWFVAYRLEDDFDKTIQLSRDLYPKSTQVLSMEVPTNFTSNIYNSFKQECSADMPCKEFSNSKTAFYWVLDTLKDYHGKRYGGYTFNETHSVVWYNNKGYHAMMGWLNDLNTHIFQQEMNDTSYSINAYNEPWKLGYSELSTSSILRQAGDSCMAFILLIAFSLVVAVASVYLVNERMKGEKLQQKLCGVDAATYWGVAFVWDFLVILLAILVCTVIILAFHMPVFVDRQQLWGVIVLAIFFGFACIPAVHVFEKCFTDASVAIVSIFVMNVIIPLFTMAIIVLLGVIGDSPTWDEWRFFLNRAFLIFPQHALGDGLLEICKNYMVALTFHRYDIDSYKNPVNSDLLKPHYIALFVLGVFFLLVNVLLESGKLYEWKAALVGRFNFFYENEKRHLEELKIVSIQSSLKRDDKFSSQQAVRVENLCKSYQPGQYVVKNVSFAVQSGECFGLLGKNGAGKSTIFKMLSGQLQPTLGTIHYFNKEISYCPQTNTLDALLTVKQCIEFYGRLRRVKDISKLVSSLLEFYQLEAYADVLVKNLSGGNRRKLTVATTCCGRTSVVLMDEPTSDMDPVTRAIVYRTIHELLAEQRAIVLTSHTISEIDEICHRIAVLKDGQILTCSRPESLKAQFGGLYNVTVYCDQSKLEEMEKLLRQRFAQIIDLRVYNHSIKFSIKIEEALEKIAENGIDLPHHLKQTPQSPHMSLANLFQALNDLSHKQSPSMLSYAVNRCRLDTVFERVLDSHASDVHSNGHTNSMTYAGSPSTGYIHNGYIETETIT